MITVAYSRLEFMPAGMYNVHKIISCPEVCYCVQALRKHTVDFYYTFSDVTIPL